jgi:hypothetical protein
MWQKAALRHSKCDLHSIKFAYFNSMRLIKLYIILSIIAKVKIGQKWRLTYFLTRFKLD